MPIRVVRDFLAETRALYDALEGLGPKDYARVTQFRDWTIDDVLVHLHFWNRAADLASTDPDTFEDLAARVTAAFATGSGLRPLENAEIKLRGEALREAWLEHAVEMAKRWHNLDPKARLPWVGPSMSLLTAATARQMETWAHGYEVLDVLGLERVEDDRIHNIVVLGVNTFGWSHKVHGLDVPEAMPLLDLTAPSGQPWTFGSASAGRISGPAADFAAVVTQTRALADTALKVEGPVAERWMAHAQCFAGPPSLPPAPGSRFRA